MTELNIVLTSFKLIYVIIILSMANQGGDVDWNKKRQQAQPYINKIRSLLEKKEVNDETWLNVLSTRYLEKGTIECRNVGVNN